MGLMIGKATHVKTFERNRKFPFSLFGYKGLADLEYVLDLSYRFAAKKNVPVSDKILEEAFDASHPGEKKYWDNEYWRG